ncbi:MAG: helix-turn-helix domain-containing protein [Patescibacteria group bacterium]
MDKFFTPSEVAQFFKVKTITIRRWIAKGALPAINLEGKYRVSEKDLNKFILDRKTVGKRGDR